MHLLSLRLPFVLLFPEILRYNFAYSIPIPTKFRSRSRTHHKLRNAIPPNTSISASRRLSASSATPSSQPTLFSL